MATLFRRGPVWWLRYSTGGRQVRESLQTTNRKVAEELRVQREVDLMRQRRPEWAGPVVPTAAPAVAVAVVEREPGPDLAAVRSEYEGWSKAHKGPKTILNDKGRLDAFFATVAGKELRDVTTADVERFLTAEAKKGRKPATLLRHREILHAFWRWALRQEHVERNVVSDIPRPRLPERDPRFLNLVQVEQVLQAVAGDVIEPAVATAVFAGLRREELCWVTRDDVDLNGAPAMLRVRAKTVDGKSWQPKTKRDRKVPISGRLLAVLQKWRNGPSGRHLVWVSTVPN